MPIDHTQPYDDQNILAKVLRGELPSRKVYENDHAVVIHDINPLAPVHLLALPKGPYVSWDDFSAKASDAEQAGLTKAIGEAARVVEASTQGYRVLSNVGKRGGQEIAHLHVHIFGGQPLGPMLAR
ncbi:HIT domain-containing protein [Sphingomonas sp. KRR8]|jgi:histidine triad (HIT) family protein|uniref:HIT domain-containing protein n=1 Tax=Sphingomonas sp. KRR8 TaxID=2942996 RepID=UPI0020214227|nr:HIT domain-containing protein [Sphingomonas sp. KRR8]URD60453.1 HIT domain-containing protein [Sphingomonas sp. KRR8]